MPRNSATFGMNNRKILLATSLLIGSLCLIFGVLYQLHIRRFSHLDDPVTPTADPRQQLDFESGALSQEIRDQQTRELKTYRWMDPDHRLAAVPLKRAEEIYLREAAGK